MKTLRWNIEKAKWLREQPERNAVGFEECAVLIEAGHILDDIDNPSRNFPDQKAYVLAVDEYVYLVPYVETDEEIFLKTVYPSRKLTALYMSKTSP
jgi:hypothetical protein